MKTGEAVKIFVRGDDEDGGFSRLEQEINDWLAERPGIEIVERLTNSSIGTSKTRMAVRHDDGTFMSVSVIIFYR